VSLFPRFHVLYFLYVWHSNEIIQMKFLKENKILEKILIYFFYPFGLFFTMRMKAFINISWNFFEILRKICIVLKKSITK
jgi:hypothetical protein